MATITTIKRKSGTRYRAQIRIRRGGKIVYTETKSFTTKQRARSWSTRREDELADVTDFAALAKQQMTIGAAIEQYLEAHGEAFGRTKVRSLKRIATMPLAQRVITECTAQDVLTHLTERRRTVAPSTAEQDLVWITGILEHARYAWNLPVNTQMIHDARRRAKLNRLVGKPEERDRRPTNDELSRLREWFNRAHVGPGSPSAYPMAEIMDFAIASTRRQGEITRLLWADLDEDNATCWLRDAKRPTGSQGNHRRFALTSHALAIIQRQPRTSEYIFPYNSKTIGAYWTRACKMLGIHDLHFHDLRHEGTSRLFEAGYQIHEVQQFTLHDQWSTLQRYTQLRPEHVSGR